MTQDKDRNDESPSTEYQGASEEELDAYYAWEYRPEYEQVLEEDDESE